MPIMPHILILFTFTKPDHGERSFRHGQVKIPHRNSLAGAKPHPHGGQCPCRNDGLEGCHPAARVSAANAILDRGWGKATQPLANGDDGALELIHRIERVIVHPENSDS